MNYCPEALEDRQQLATSLEAMFSTAGFVKVSGETTEDVYERQVPQVPGARIVVFSSVYHGSARGNGADAIRVAVLYRRKDGVDRSLVSEGRVNRTGTVEGITSRTLDRMRSAYTGLRDRTTRGLTCRKCGAPLHLSKRGHEVCAETCWLVK